MAVCTLLNSSFPSRLRCALCTMTSGVDYHHEIPRAYGGENGPTTPLCSGHHTLVHNLALQLYKHGKEHLLSIPEDVPKENQGKLIVLVRTIVIARRRFEEEKRLGNVERKGSAIRLDGRRMAKLVDLTRLLKCSQQDAANQAIDRLHQSLTARGANK